MWIRSLVSSSLLALVASGCSVSSSSYRDSSAALSRINLVPASIDDGAELFAGDATLAVGPLVEAVLARNPSVERSRQGWRAALALYPSASSLADPRLSVTVAPLSFFDEDVRIGVGASITQPLPFPGKRRLRGEIVLAEADAARADFAAVTQRLALMATELYYDYYIATRAIAINREHLELLAEYSKLLDGYLATNKAFGEDALKVDIEIAELEQERAALSADRDVVVAQLNALLHRRQRSRLPAPPTELPLATAVAEKRDQLVALALASRPELAGANSRIRGAGAEVRLADREYYPDLAVAGTYNRMWPALSHQVMIGLSIDIPLTRGARAAASDAANAKRARQRADRDDTVDDVMRDVETSLRRVAEADESAALYRERVLPAANSRIDAVRIGLDAGRTTFLELIRAERVLRGARLRYDALAAGTHRRRAQLDWAIGRLPGGSTGAKR